MQNNVETGALDAYAAITATGGAGMLLALGIFACAVLSCMLFRFRWWLIGFLLAAQIASGSYLVFVANQLANHTGSLEYHRLWMLGMAFYMAVFSFCATAGLVVVAFRLSQRHVADKGKTHLQR